MRKLSAKDREDIRRIVSRPPITAEAVDNCPIIQECRRIGREVEEEYSKDPEKVDAEIDALIEEWGIEYADEIPTPPWVKAFIEESERDVASNEIVASAKQ